MHFSRLIWTGRRCFSIVAKMISLMRLFPHSHPRACSSLSYREKASIRFLSEVKPPHLLLMLHHRAAEHLKRMHYQPFPIHSISKMLIISSFHFDWEVRDKCHSFIRPIFLSWTCGTHSVSRNERAGSSLLSHLETHFSHVCYFLYINCVGLLLFYYSFD